MSVKFLFVCCLWKFNCNGKLSVTKDIVVLLLILDKVSYSVSFLDFFLFCFCFFFLISLARFRETHSILGFLRVFLF